LIVFYNQKTKKGISMSLLTTEEKIQCLKNLLVDPDCWISSELLRLNNDEDDAPEGSNGPIGINEWSPEAQKLSNKS
jgi:hypothetical protein